MRRVRQGGGNCQALTGLDRGDLVVIASDKVDLYVVSLVFGSSHLERRTVEARSRDGENGM